MIKNLLNPFYLSEKKLLTLGVIALLIGLCIGFSLDTRFDGVIDLHFTENVQIFQLILDLLIAIIVTAIVLFLTGLFINKKTRIVDLLITVLIAKVPFYFLPIVNIGNKMFEISNKISNVINPNSHLKLLPEEILFLTFSSLLSVLAIIWSIILLFNGFKTATNSKEIKHSIVFITGIVLSEIISKIIIYTLN